MDTLNKPLITVPLKFGAIGGLLVVLMFLIAYWMGKNPLIDLKFFDFLILPIFIFFSIKEFKDYKNGGILHFWQGMTVGVINYLTLAFISALFTLLFINFIDTQLVDLYIADRVEIIDLKKQEMIDQMGEETYRSSRSEMLGTSGFILALDDFLKKCLIGLTLTIPVSVILRRRAI